MASVICEEVVCPCCKVERPVKEVICVDEKENYWQCKICIMLHKEATVPGKPKTKAELVAFKEAITARKLGMNRPKPKEEPKSAVCPGCLKTLDIIDFKGVGGKTFSHCNCCRDNNIKIGDERAKRLLGGGLFSGVSMTLGRCIQCGHTGQITTDFPVDTKEPTGYKRYCLKKCGGRRR